MNNVNRQRISIISALSENRVIGINNKLPWHLPGDWEHFREITAGKAFIMGRTSYESEDALLSSYRNVVLSRRRALILDEKSVQAQSIEEGIALLNDEPEIFILGGAQIFAQSLSYATFMYLTIVHGHFEGDAFFPEVNWNEWEELSSQFHSKDEKHDYAFSIKRYRRVS